MASECKLRQITFSHDKESKILSFTGKVEKKKAKTLDIVCDGQHNSETATYLIYPRVEDIHT
jgi:hypothetical protein